MEKLDPSVIHVWTLRLGPADPLALAYWACLNDAERARAGRFLAESARVAFVHTRGYLRRLLGEYLDLPPERVEFIVNDHGKPRLRDAEENQGLVFNVSHSGPFALLAFTRDAALGVDVEECRVRSNLEGLAGMCLAPDELALWRGLPPDRQADEFIRRWACKEAFVKAVGRGIGLGLGKVCVSPGFTGYAAVPEAHGPAADWRLREWASGNCRAALAYRGGERRVSFFDPAS
ncbi:4'-phosphopantetheinyl transferase family protein [Methylomagnum sp.]